jgi:DNA-binding GntR family transcriptional regulator
MRRPARSTAHESELISRGNLRQQVMARILTGVFQGRLHSKQRLVVQRLAERYGVSPTPVREALVELAGLGLVDLLPNRGAVVRPFGPQEVREISQVRRVLEVEATRCACGRTDPENLKALERDLVRLQDLPRDVQWDRDARSADTRLHGLIADSCGSTRLREEVNRYLTLFRTLRDVSHERDAGTNYSHSNDVPEHLEILHALIAQDPEAAAEAMDRHIRSAARNLEQVVFATPLPGPKR